jgi:ABC-type uncharacterized transport system auxiliary subunit
MRATENSVRPTESLTARICRTWRQWRGAAGLALLAAGLCGCGSAKPVHYFQLTHPPTTTLSGAEAPIDAVLLVRVFQTSHIYREDRIVYGDDGVQIGLYENDRWTQPPAELLQDALTRALRSSGQLRMVTTMRSDASVDYSLGGQLYSFREVTGGNLVARLRFDVQLTDLKKGKVIWRHAYNHDEPVAGKSVPDIATAMDKNVHQAMQEIQDGIVQTLTEYTKRKVGAGGE